jgi:hypothetical protein
MRCIYPGRQGSREYPPGMCYAESSRVARPGSASRKRCRFQLYMKPHKVVMVARIETSSGQILRGKQGVCWSWRRVRAEWRRGGFGARRKRGRASRARCSGWRASSGRTTSASSLRCSGWWASRRCSAIAVATAFAGWGDWAVVAKPILQLGMTAIGAWSSCPCLAGGARITPEMKGLVRFGLGIAGFALSDQLDQLALA